MNLVPNPKPTSACRMLSVYHMQKEKVITMVTCFLPSFLRCMEDLEAVNEDWDDGFVAL